MNAGDRNIKLARAAVQGNYRRMKNALNPSELFPLHPDKLQNLRNFTRVDGMILLLQKPKYITK